MASTQEIQASTDINDSLDAEDIFNVDTYIQNNIDSILNENKVNLFSESENKFAEFYSDEGLIYNLPVYTIDISELVEDITGKEAFVQTEVIDTSNATESNISPLAAGNKYEEAWDSTLSVRAWSTNYYDKKTVSGKTMYLLKTVSGGRSISQPDAQITSQTLVYGCTDMLNVQTATKYPTGSSWSYSTGFTKYVSPDNGPHAMGNNITFKIRRSTSTTWTFRHQNNVI